MWLGNVPRVRLAHLPTPVEELTRLRQEVERSPRLFIKRDDATGLAVGGNKARKLEFLVADALRQGACTLVTAGGPQSNHARMTAAAANRFGLNTVLVFDGEAGVPLQGNQLLDRLLGADMRFSSLPAPEALEEVARELRGQGRHPYVIPVGGSTGLGALGYALAMQELVEWGRDHETPIDHVVVASGSGGTQAGLEAVVWSQNLPSKIIGMSVSRAEAALAELVSAIATEAVRCVGLKREFSPADITVRDQYVGPGYAQVTPECLDAIELVAQTEGIILDPVYTGKAMAGLLGLIGEGFFEKEDNVIFIHTGGTPGLFAYADHFTG